MKSNKELVYDFIKRYSGSHTAHENSGVSTLYLAEELGMQRTNISSILNQLVNEGLIEKNNGRPVLYYLKNDDNMQETDTSCFKNFIGYDSSLRNAVQLAKAAILYPQKSLHTLIVGPAGSGKSFFVQLMVQFAKDNGIIKEDAEFIKFNCKNYVDDEKQMVQMLFGEKSEGFENYFDRAQSNILFIDHVDLLPSYIRNKLFGYIENQKYYYLNSKIPQHKDVQLICTCSDDVNKMVLEHYSHKIPVRINLPSLRARSLKERFQLIQHFFMLESLRIQKRVEINSEILRCLMMYDCPLDVKQLRGDIQMGCANAFVREFQISEEKMNIYMSDFDNYVRKGFLNYPEFRNEVEKIIPDNYSYSFSGSNMETNEMVESQLKKANIYDTLMDKIRELKKRGISENDIGMILNVELESIFKLYKSQIPKEIVNKEQLSKLVDSRIINLVESFLKEASLRFNAEYPVSVFYGLCLHLNSTIERMHSGQSISSNQITGIIEKHKEEYSFSLQFSLKLEEEMNVKLPIEEVVFITMFICEQITDNEKINRPSVLIAMHGENTASSIAEVVNALGQANNTDSYDLFLDKNSQEAYEELKKKIESIDHGKGVIVIYDMGSIKTMCDLISQETNIKIRLICMPVTLIALSCSRKATVEEDIDKLAEDIMEDVKFTMEDTDINPAKKCIITLCNTGEGGAKQLKEYIEKYTDCSYQEIIALPASDRNGLINQINNIRVHYNIQAIVGTFDPKLYGIPFISISKVLEAKPLQLKQVLQFKDVSANEIDYKAIYEYLDEQLEYIDVKKVEKILPKVMKEIREAVDEDLSTDQELGLLVHIACAINRISAKEKLPINMQKEIIFNKYETLCKAILKIFRQLERAFEIIFSDDEIAHVVAIIKKI